MPNGNTWRRRLTQLLVALGAALLFVVLATLNAGGYRYGVSDQAFYIPAILHHLDPQLFPRDWPMIGAQDRLNIFTASLALKARVTGLSLPVLFFLAHLVSLAILFGAVVAIGRTLYRSWWAVAALAIAMTLRHRVVQTGVNTLESYMHPRMMAFAVGAAAVAMFLQGSSWAAILLAIAAGLIHPTTGVWFCLWIGVAALISDRRARPPLVGIVAALGIAAIGALAWLGMPAGLFARMDGTWLSVLRSRDYLFPDAWHAWAWGLMLAYPILIGVLFRSRATAGVVGTRERGLVVGSLALFLILLVALPLIAARFAVVVRLQVPRVLWMMELLATAYVVWWLVDRPSRRTGGAGISPGRLAVVGLLAVFAVTRGAYVTFVEHAGSPVVRLDLAADEWRDAMDWLSKTPAASHVLADPGHAWKYGSSVRVAASRDVLQEEGKDLAFALYSRDTAVRVLERIGDIGDFQQMTAGRARELAAKYDLDYLVAERPFDLPVVYRNARFNVYRLQPE
jgi:hypothetical protein